MDNFLSLRGIPISHGPVTVQNEFFSYLILLQTGNKINVFILNEIIEILAGLQGDLRQQTFPFLAMIQSISLLGLINYVTPS